MNRKPLIDETGEVRELNAADIEDFKPASDALPGALQRTLDIKSREAQKAPTKAITTMRLDPQVLDAFRATGKGWQSRVNEILRQNMP